MINEDVKTNADFFRTFKIKQPGDNSKTSLKMCDVSI